MLSLYFDVSEALDEQQRQALISETQLKTYLQTTLSFLKKDNVELTVKAVTKAESQQLNADYRNKDKPTNVLSFPSDYPEFVESNYIGDIVVCVQVLIDEASQQGKAVTNHWAHLSVHGLLHLLGYDHIQPQEAEEMEAIETSVLAILGIDDPYFAS